MRSGFSVTTVSHVLNEVEGKRIPQSTRDRVRLAARELSYRPNRLAQDLRMQRSNTLGFVSDQIGTSPHAGQTIVGAQEAASERGFLLMLMNSWRDPELENREITALLDRQVDGIVYAAEYHRVVEPPTALTQTCAVLLDARSDRGEISSVVPDESGAAVTAVEELVSHGHLRIGYLNNESDIPATRLRLSGLQEALREHGLPFDPGLVATDVSESWGGYQAASALLDVADRPTALFCFNDRMAMGAYQAAADRGLRVPDDLSVVGFDNQELIAGGLRPGLTTVALPHYEMGRWAVTTLLEAIDSDGAAPVRHEALPCPLVRRASVGPPPRL